MDAHPHHCLPRGLRHAVALALTLALATAAPAASPSRDAAAPVAPAFPVMPLPGDLVLTGSFGEYRNSHLHAGLDFSTGGEVGMAVLSSLPGVVERIRTQGVGYGRSVYVRAPDGRLLVYAHLEAFDEPIASYVQAIQDSSGQYEQDLWPPPGRMTLRQGQRLGWSGRSGTGSPHLHFEVRHGDMALNPLRAGIAMVDSSIPEIQAVTLEPLDERSTIERGARPLTLVFPRRGDTLVAEGRLRAVARAVDPGERRSNMAPWSIGLEWRGAVSEVRFDSVSWATDLHLREYHYDSGRAAAFSKMTVQLWAGPGVRPRTFSTSVPDDQAAGLIEVAAGDPARALRITTRDLAGHASERVIWLRGPGPAESGPDSVRTGTCEKGVRFGWGTLPDGRLRVHYRGAPPAALAVRINGRAASFRAGEWCVVLAPAGETLRAVASGLSAEGRAWADSSESLVLAAEEQRRPSAEARRFDWQLGHGRMWEPAVVLADVAGGAVQAPPELQPRSRGYALLPAEVPLKSPAVVRIQVEGGEGQGRLGLYRRSDEGWDWLGGRYDPGTRSMVAESRRLGRFAVLEDVAGPRIALRTPPSRWGTREYPTWALAAALAEDGSGVDARATHFVVDGRRVPSEWDAVRGELRWRPAMRPAPGRHRFEVVAVDRAGNVSRTRGSFVLD
jgi:hypothetical protein